MHVSSRRLGLHCLCLARDATAAVLTRKDLQDRRINPREIMSPGIETKVTRARPLRTATAITLASVFLPLHPAVHGSSSLSPVALSFPQISPVALQPPLSVSVRSLLRPRSTPSRPEPPPGSDRLRGWSDCLRGSDPRSCARPSGPLPLRDVSYRLHCRCVVIALSQAAQQLMYVLAQKIEGMRGGSIEDEEAIQAEFAAGKTPYRLARPAARARLAVCVAVPLSPAPHLMRAVGCTAVLPPAFAVFCTAAT